MEVVPADDKFNDIKCRLLTAIMELGGRAMIDELLTTVPMRGTMIIKFINYLESDGLVRVRRGLVELTESGLSETTQCLQRSAS